MIRRFLASQWFDWLMVGIVAALMWIALFWFGIWS